MCLLCVLRLGRERKKVRERLVQERQVYVSDNTNLVDVLHAAINRYKVQ